MKFNFDSQTNFDVVGCKPIREIEMVQDNVFIKDNDGDVWRFSVGYDGVANIQLIKRG